MQFEYVGIYIASVSMTIMYLMCVYAPYVEMSCALHICDAFFHVYTNKSVDDKHIPVLPMAHAFSQYYTLKGKNCTIHVHVEAVCSLGSL